MFMHNTVLYLSLIVVDVGLIKSQAQGLGNYILQYPNGFTMSQFHLVELCKGVLMPQGC